MGYMRKISYYKYVKIAEADSLNEGFVYLHY